MARVSRKQTGLFIATLVLPTSPGLLFVFSVTLLVVEVEQQVDERYSDVPRCSALAIGTDVIEKTMACERFQVPEDPHICGLGPFISLRGFTYKFDDLIAFTNTSFADDPLAILQHSTTNLSFINICIEIVRRHIR